MRINMEKKLLSAEDVANQIGCSVQHIYQMARKNKITHYRLGNYIKFPLNIIDEILKKSTSHENEV